VELTIHLTKDVYHTLRLPYAFTAWCAMQEDDMDLGVWFYNRTAGFLLHAIHYSGVYICGLWKVMTRKDSLQLAC
jgi:hypothetical protein